MLYMVVYFAGFCYCITYTSLPKGSHLYNSRRGSVSNPLSTPGLPAAIQVT